MRTPLKRSPAPIPFFGFGVSWLGFETTPSSLGRGTWRVGGAVAAGASLALGAGRSTSLDAQGRTTPRAHPLPPPPQRAPHHPTTNRTQQDRTRQLPWVANDKTAGPSLSLPSTHKPVPKLWACITPASRKTQWCPPACPVASAGDCPSSEPWGRRQREMVKQRKVGKEYGLVKC